MDPSGLLLQQVKLRAFDLSERTLRRSRQSAIRRAERWRQRAFLIGQCAVTAALAWLVARLALGHPQPIFAPVAAILTLGLTFGQRLRRGLEVAAGVAVGVGVGDLWVHFFGTGVWQIAVVCALAMSIATLLGAGPLMTSQAGVQSMFVIAAGASFGYGVNRWLDAVLGCGVALLAATLAPGAPLRRPGTVAAGILIEMADTLDAATNALAARDEQAAARVLDRARAGEAGLAALDRAAAEGLAVVRQSPFRRRHLRTVSALAELHEPLDHASRNLRVLARRSAVAVWRGQEVPASYLDAATKLAEVCRFMAAELREERLPTHARERLRGLATVTAHVELTHSLSAVVILAQIRSMVADLLELTGMTYSEAREVIPDID